MRLDVKNTRSTDGEHVWKTTDEFLQTYWSGLDARVFANDLFLAELVSLQWSLTEAVAPLYSYAAYVYDTVMHGARSVQGSFTLNFQNDSRLYTLLARLDQENRTSDTPASYRTTDAYRVAAEGQAQLADLLALAGSADGLAPNGTGGQVRLDPRLIAAVAEDFTAALWRDTNRDDLDVVQQTTNQLLAFTGADRPRFGLKRPFDLNISFGSSDDATELSRRQLTRLTGQEQLKGQALVFPISTATKIVGVHLTGVERVVDDSGRPILESYSFMARDVV